MFPAEVIFLSPNYFERMFMYLPGTTKEDSSPLRAASVSFVPPPTVGMAEIT